MKEHEQLKGSVERALRYSQGEALMEIYGDLAGNSVEIACKVNDADVMHLAETVGQFQTEEVRAALNNLGRLSEYGGAEYANQLYGPNHYLMRTRNERTVIRAALKALGWVQ